MFYSSNETSSLVTQANVASLHSLCGLVSAGKEYGELPPFPSVQALRLELRAWLSCSFLLTHSSLLSTFCYYFETKKDFLNHVKFLTIDSYLGRAKNKHIGCLFCFWGMGHMFLTITKSRHLF